jgi:hypothetical protein
MKLAFIAIVWLGMATFDYGAQLGDLQGRWNGDPQFQAEMCRQNMGFAAGWSLVTGPIGFAVTPFTTGFYEHGFKWTCEASKP